MVVRVVAGGGRTCRENGDCGGAGSAWAVSVDGGAPDGPRRRSLPAAAAATLAGQLPLLAVCRLAAGAGAGGLERAAEDAGEPEDVEAVEAQVGRGVPVGAIQFLVLGRGSFRNQYSLGVLIAACRTHDSSQPALTREPQRNGSAS